MHSLIAHVDLGLLIRNRVVRYHIANTASTTRERPKRMPMGHQIDGTVRNRVGYSAQIVMRRRRHTGHTGRSDIPWSTGHRLRNRRISGVGVSVRLNGRGNHHRAGRDWYGWGGWFHWCRWHRSRLRPHTDRCLIGSH